MVTKGSKIMYSPYIYIYTYIISIHISIIHYISSIQPYVFHCQDAITVITLGGYCRKTCSSDARNKTGKTGSWKVLPTILPLQVVEPGLFAKNPTDPTCFKDSGGGLALQVAFLVLLRLTHLWSPLRQRYNTRCCVDSAPHSVLISFGSRLRIGKICLDWELYRGCYDVECWFRAAIIHGIHL